MERAADVEEGFVQTAPLVFHFGHKSAADNLPLFNLLTSRLAEVINVRSEQSHKGKLYYYACALKSIINLNTYNA